MPDETDDADSQDLAEVFDETNTTEDGEDIATPDMQRDVLDVTSSLDDADEDGLLAEDEDFDPDQADDEELDAMAEVPDEPRTFRDDADLVKDEDLQPADLESGDTPHPAHPDEGRGPGEAH